MAFLDWKEVYFAGLSVDICIYADSGQRSASD